MKAKARLNAVCPYFTMFPLDFPLGVLRNAEPGQLVVDPFCGRGTTNYAARTLNLASIGVDSSPVAVALSRAKIANATPPRIVAAARRILRDVPEPSDVPDGEFWRWAFHHDVLRILCRLREGLLANCRSDARKALRAIVLGALARSSPKISSVSLFQPISKDLRSQTPVRRWVLEKARSSSRAGRRNRDNKRACRTLLLR